MNDPEVNKKYWLASADDDWTAAGHLCEKGDYPHALFFAHLTVEKVLKAVWAVRVGGVPPHTHRLTLLAEKTQIELTPERQGAT
jgi:HEPN domain-containing protein